ncbi:MAG: hypothetical protein EA411_07825 [Saprospirales bacterium]|nr:MAG: hypothetical protein EA411_07825 [Saprospirales bacterium]
MGLTAFSGFCADRSISLVLAIEHEESWDFQKVPAKVYRFHAWENGGVNSPGFQLSKPQDGCSDPSFGRFGKKVGWDGYNFKTNH